jgi:hypothetical protein
VCVWVCMCACARARRCMDNINTIIQLLVLRMWTEVIRFRRGPVAGCCVQGDETEHHCLLVHDSLLPPSVHDNGSSSFP